MTELPPPLPAPPAEAAPPPPPPPRWRVLAEQAARIAWAVLKVVFSPHPPRAPVAPHAHDGPLAVLAATFPLPTWQPAARAVAALVAMFFLWSALARLDEVAIANGEVIPEGKVKTIQHLEGGIVRDIYVTEGAEVKEGTPLIQLELPTTAMNREELRVRLDGLVLQRARLEAEINDKPLVFPPDEAKRQPKLVEAETRSFEARRAALRSTLAVLADQSEQKRHEVIELQTRQQSVGNSLKLARERLAMSKDLLKSGLTARMEHVQLEAQVQELDGQLNSVRASIPRAQAGETESHQRMEEEKAKVLRAAQGEMATAELDIARTQELLTQASDQQSRTQITSPIDGVVKNLHANTVGGVIRGGDPIMEIVPLHERLLIEARLSPVDRGYVRPGQAAVVKLSAYDYTTYGGLDGKVTLVAPDTTTVPDQEPYYRVVVETDKGYLGDKDDLRAITAGMQATVDIKTGTRSVLEYLIKPVLKLRHEAFRER
jgi:adhesin transport system membrane fusion protein